MQYLIILGLFCNFSVECPVDFFQNYNVLIGHTAHFHLITINSDFLCHCLYHHFIHQTIAIITWFNFKTVTVTIYNVSCIFLSLRYFFCSCMQGETLIEQRQVLIFPLPLTPTNVLLLFISLNEKRNDLIWLIMIYEYLNNVFPIWLHVDDAFYKAQTKAISK